MWFISAILVLAIWVAMIACFGTWILGPLDKAARSRQHPVQFTTLDSVCLMWLVQLPLSIVHSTMSIEEIVSGGWTLDALGAIASALMWWGGVRTMSRAGVHNRWHRSIFLAIVVPVTYYGIVAFCVVLVAWILAFSGERRIPFLLTACLVFLVCAFILCARFVRMILRDTASAPDEKHTSLAPDESQGSAQR